MKIPDTFVLIERRTRQAIKGNIVTMESSKRSRCLFRLSPDVVKALGHTKENPTYLQLYLSATAIKFVKCRADAHGARRIDTKGYVMAGELGELLQLPETFKMVCNTEIVPGVTSKPMEVWAGFPQQFRDHIDELNRAAR